MPTELGVRAAARAVRDRTLSPLELLDAYLARVADHDARLGTFATLLADRARVRAREIGDALVRGDLVPGPLTGVPYAVKDIVAVAGVPMTAGSRLPALLPTADAPVVRALDAAGAVLMGTTRMFELALAASEAEVDADFVGPRNPWDTGRTAGGSSSGSAAAAAARLSAFTVGTDTGGSVRIPAAFCGVVGLKPTTGSVPGRGVLPLSWSLDVPGWFTHDADDAALLLEVLATGPAGPPAPAMPSVGVLPVDALDVERLDPVVVREVEHAADVLAQAGCPVRTVDLGLLPEWQQALSALVSFEGYRSHAGRYETSPDLVGRYAAERFEHGAAMAPSDYRAALDVQERCERRFAEVLADVDVLLLPAVPFPAPTVEEVRRLGGRVHAHFTRPVNLAGLPAVSVPGRPTATGLPTAVQVVAARGRDHLALSVAETLERCRGPLPAWGPQDG